MRCSKHKDTFKTIKGQTARANADTEKRPWYLSNNINFRGFVQLTNRRRLANSLGPIPRIPSMSGKLDAGIGAFSASLANAGDAIVGLSLEAQT